LGIDFLDIFPIPEPKRVLYLGAELSEAALRERLLKMEDALPKHIDSLVVYVDHSLNLDSTLGSGYKKIEGCIEEYGIEVVMIDPLYQFTSADETRMKETQSFRKTLDTLINRHDVSVVLIHHSTKEAYSSYGHQYSRGIDEMRGAGWAQWVDSVLKLGINRQDDTKQILFDKLRHAPRRPPVKVQFNPETFSFDAIDLTPEDKLIQVLWKNGGQMSTTDLKAKVQGYPGLKHVNRTVAAMEEKGQVRTRKSTKEEYNKPGAKPDMVELIN
jgi:hypothetical protein